MGVAAGVARPRRTVVGPLVGPLPPPLSQRSLSGAFPEPPSCDCVRPERAPTNNPGCLEHAWRSCMEGQERVGPSNLSTCVRRTLQSHLHLRHASRLLLQAPLGASSRWYDGGRGKWSLLALVTYKLRSVRVTSPTGTVSLLPIRRVSLTRVHTMYMCGRTMVSMPLGAVMS